MNQVHSVVGFITVKTSQDALPFRADRAPLCLARAYLEIRTPAPSMGASNDDGTGVTNLGHHVRALTKMRYKGQSTPRTDFSRRIMRISTTLVPVFALLSHGIDSVSAQHLLLLDNSYGSTQGPPLPPVATDAAPTPSNLKNSSILTPSVSAVSDPSATITAAKRFKKRAAIPECLKSVEVSCLNLAANCIDTIGMDTSRMNNLWGVKSCVAAATCYGVGDLITSVKCQTGLSTTNTAQASLDYTNIYAPIVGDCAWASSGCPITQQNYIDFYYSELTAINTANYPSSNTVVIAWWNAITAWAATGSTVPYLNFDDWLHFSSAPATTTDAPPPPLPSYTQIEWNPNPAPPPGAISETFVSGTITQIIPIPHRGQASWHFVLCAKVALGRKLGGSWSVVGHFV
ncbi:hypothetical protein FB45DRAFT_1034423 [Roridomyces roridus]|uniref:Uncharacterized protein n=1 Tax=Roridomyces roridus TaxID=1738132 RepID=A0AAD7BCD1_9AGAR|nr:hypothetical protein FB45DRAFT_1034423 [Roridomyces roridus]